MLMMMLMMMMMATKTLTIASVCRLDRAWRRAGGWDGCSMGSQMCIDRLESPTFDRMHTMRVAGVVTT
jgi:hypothetical protein